MSRRRRRDEKDENDIHSENESQVEESGKLSDYTDSDLEDLDASEYESVDEEENNSSEEEQDSVPPPEQTTEDAPEISVDTGTQRVGTPHEEPDVETERESGDGKEQSDNEQHRVEGGEEKDDKAEEEDPAFIPRKGAFFQHDLRSENQPKGRGRDRKIWDKEPVKWSHDMFIMEEQMPKSRDILISEYGYDIRSRPIDASPPTDTRRPGRGRGRGRGRGGFRGRRGRPAMPQEEQQEYNNNNDEYPHEYPSLGNKGTGVKHRSKSYWKSDYKRDQDAKFQGPQRENKQTAEEEPQNTSYSNKENTSQPNDTGTTSPKMEASDEAKNEKFSDILDVINSHEQGKSNSQPTSQSSKSRQHDKLSKNHQPLSYSNYQEPPKPRRYSSLRLRHSPVDKQMGQYSQRNQEPRYSNFAKPVQPKQTTTFESKNYSDQNSTSIQSQAIKEEVQTAVAPASEQGQTTHVSQPVPTSMPLALSHQPQPMTYTDPATQANLGAPLDPSLMQMPPMGFPYNPMLNPMYFDPAAYQRMMQMMSRMGMDQMQQQPPPTLPHQLESANSAIAPPDAQSLPHPAHMQMNPLLPPVSQGSLGSIMRPPPPPHNPPTYFAGPMGMNPGMPHQPFNPSFQPNLMAQQVGGVTYFNTPQSPPTLPPTLGPQDSPRRNAAIPIMAPTGFAPAFE